jgi:hypothetical protein
MIKKLAKPPMPVVPAEMKGRIKVVLNRRVIALTNQF